MSYSFYIGKNLVAEGLAYLAGYGDEPSSHWLEIIPHQQHPSGESIEVGVTALDLTEILTKSLETKTRILYGIRPQTKPKSPSQIW